SLRGIEEAEWLFEQTGKYPALIGLDFMDHTRNYNWIDKNVLVNEAVKWYRKNGLVTICWHWRDPLRNTEEFYTNGTTFDVTKINDVNSEEYTAMVDDIDYIAGYLKQIQDSAVPVLFRPLHEASGGWFWWGAKGAEPCKTLWKFMFDRLVNHHGINNLIWIWTTDAQSDNLDWYPGDDYVDILGMDIYAPDGDYGSQVLNFNKIKDDFEGKKLITLSENGNIPDPDKLVTDKAGWSWFMPWYGKYIRDNAINSLEHWQKIMDHPYVITLDEMPDLKNFSFLNSNIETNKFLVFPINETIHLVPDNVNDNYSVYVVDATGRQLKILKNVSGQLYLNTNGIKGLILIKIIGTGFEEVYKVIL
ncbi:MAG: hypothetical protein HC906_17865, partial [Bacteroidales bacterium]|nr:hypothetical protein [Bacteroidales bacterium]